MRARYPSRREEFSGPAHLAAMSMLTGYALCTWRTRTGLSLEQAGKILGCTGGHLSRVERGLRIGPTPEHAAEKLGVTVGEFLTPCAGCGWDPPEGTTCAGCGTSQTAEQLAAEIVSWVVWGGR